MPLWRGVRLPNDLGVIRHTIRRLGVRNWATLPRSALGGKAAVFGKARIGLLIAEAVEKVSLDLSWRPSSRGLKYREK